MVNRFDLKPRPSPSRCTICHGDEDPESLSKCHRCGTLCHLDCFSEIGGKCPTIGCTPREPRPSGSFYMRSSASSPQPSWLTRLERRGARFERLWQVLEWLLVSPPLTLALMSLLLALMALVARLLGV